MYKREQARRKRPVAVRRSPVVPRDPANAAGGDGVAAAGVVAVCRVQAAECPAACR